MIRLEDISKTFVNREVLHDVSFTVRPGRVTALLGPNGAGKTTTMRIMTGVLIPDSGNVFINDSKLNPNNVNQRKLLGYMPESNPLYKDLLVGELLQLTQRLYGKVTRSRLDEVIAAFSLQEVFNRPIGQLSKGFKQRVGLANALIHDPEIAILDEPTEGLDPNQRNEIRKLISDIAKEKTVLISTHVLPEVEQIADHIIIMAQGKVVADDSKDQILKLTEGNTKVTVSLAQPDNVDWKGWSTVIDSQSNKIAGVTSYNLIISDWEKWLDEVHKKIKQDNWRVVKLEQQQISLENIFYQLTGGEE